MAARELYVEHRYEGQLIKAVRLNHRRRRFVLGSGVGSDLRLAGPDVSGIHAAFIKERDGWKIVDLGSESGILVDGKKATEKTLNEDTKIEVGNHEFQVHTRRSSPAMYLENKEISKKSLTHHEVVLIFKNQVEESFFLPKTKAFDYFYDGQRISLKPPSDSNWSVTEYGILQVRQRLSPLPDRVGRDSAEWDRDLFRALGITLLAILIFLPSLTLLKLLRGGAKPEETKVAQMIFDAKIVQKKREKSAEVRTRVSGQNNMQNSDTPKAAAGNVRVGKATVSTKVISNIKTSGLSQLIGKIALRAGNTSVAITTNGSVSNNNEARGVVAGSTIKGKFETSQSTGYRVSGIATGGKAGGAKGYQDGADMAVGSVGSGEVGVIDEESIIDGGLDREVIAAVIKESLGQIRYCYERHLSADPNLNGKVQVKFTIGAAGLVTAQEIGSTTLKSAMVEGCILRRVARWKFPQPKGGTSVVVTYPFLFKALN